MPSPSISRAQAAVTGRGRGRLVERAWELDAISQALTGAAAGAGATVLIEAPAGLGKSRLIAAAIEIARENRVLTLTATANELEAGFPFGLALALLEPVWLGSTRERRSALAAARAAPAAALLDAGSAPPSHASDEALHPLILGLFWLIRNLATGAGDGGDDRGLAIVVDDAHWADGPSLRVLAHLAQRLGELPVTVILAARSGRPWRDPHAAAGLRDAAGDQRLRPSALSEAGVAELVRARFPAADPELSAACGRVTLGNPLLVCELIDALDRDECAPTAQTAARLGEIIPERLRFAVAAALQSAGADARRVAHGVAVLGDGASVRHVAALTGLDSAAVLDGAGALASIDLLGAGLPLAFAQPLLGAAVLASLSPFEQAAAHLAAARILAERHADPREIAGHLLRGHADDDPTAIAPLRAAAAMALRDGAPASAVALLERALAEAPAAEQRVELLAELGEAQARAGDPGAGARLAEARRLSTDPRRRAELALAEGRAHYATGRFADAAEVLASAACELGDAEPQLGADLTATYLCSAAMVSDLHGPVVALRERLLSAISGPPTALQRAAIAHTAVHDSLLGAPRAQVRRLATLAWGDGALLHANGGLELGAPLLCAALVVADELELAIEIGDAVLTASDAERLSLAEEFVSCVRAWALYQQGRIAEAEADASAALDSPLTAGTSFAHCARAVIASCHIERGQLDHAEAVLAAHDRHVLVPPIWQALLLHTRALLRLAERHPQEALADALQAGAAIDAHYPHSSPGAIPWRSTAALAHLALGEPRPARALIKDELARAHKLGLTRMAIRNLRILGLALNGQGLEKLAQAVEAGDAYPARLEHIRALVDYGAALRRRNRRADAREPLRRGLDLSHRGGAGMLESRAQTELTAAGARPRRPAASGVDSLTVSQRPVAELAASGLTTRQIAEALFVTPKTVEFHLRQTYLKLDVTSREGLTEALTAG